MRAIEIHPPYGVGNLRLVQRPDPAGPGPGQALVRVRAVSLNHRDLLVARGQGPWRPPAGRTPVSDAAGTVLAVGEGVTRFRTGDRVVSTILPNWIDGPLTPAKLVGSLGGSGADGVLADQVLFDAETLVRAPDGLSDVEAATLPCAALTAWQALKRAGSMRPGATLLVQGTGAVSLFALQFCVAAGGRVIATSSSEEKLHRVRALGAAETINYLSCPDWDEAAKRLTGGMGVDHVIDIGGAATLGRSIEAIRFEGVVSVVGLIGGLTAELDIFQVFLKNLTIHGVETGSRAMLEEMIAYMTRHAIRPVIDSVFPIEQVQSAYRHLEAAAHLGKVCISL